MAFILVIAMIFGLDYGVKEYVDRKYTVGEQHPIWGGHVVIEKFYNRGATLGFLKEKPKVMRWLHRGIMIAVTGIFGALLIRHRADEKMTVLGLAMLLGGGCSNLFDREKKGHVVDYFWFAHRKPRKRRVIFNLSDFFIFIGAILSVLGRRCVKDELGEDWNSLFIAKKRQSITNW